MATVEDDGIPEDDGMADSGYLESQANNMDPIMVKDKHSLNQPVELIAESCRPFTFSKCIWLDVA